MSRPLQSIDRRRASDRVAKAASLVDLRLRDIEAKLINPSARLPLTPSIAIDPNVGRAEDYLVCDFTYSLTALDSRQHDVFRAKLVFNMIFRLREGDSFESDDFQAFGALGVVELAHPYVREIVHNLTFRMGLPPFVLDVAPPVVDR